MKTNICTAKSAWYVTAFAGIFLLFAFVNLGAYSPQDELAIFATRAIAMSEDFGSYDSLQAPTLEQPTLGDAPTLNPPTLEQPTLNPPTLNPPTLGDAPTLNPPTLDSPTLDDPSDSSNGYTACNISASAQSVQFGGSVTISWNTSGFSQVTLNGETVSATASRTFVIENNVTYRLIATTADGNSNCYAEVSVVCITPLPSCILHANPNSITRGNSSNLVWTTTNASSASINQNIGSVSIGTNRSRSVSPNNTTTYTMTVTNNAGDSANCATTITVNDQPVDPLPSCVISANPNSITRGNSSNLVWTTTNASSASINQNIGSVSIGTNRVKMVTPTNNITYVMTVTNSEGDSANCSTTITVTDAPVNTVPECVINATPSSISRGSSALLVWTTSNAVDASINQNIGSVSVGTNRSQSVSPTVTTTYTMTVTDADGDEDTCATTVGVTSTPNPGSFTCDDITFRADRTSLPRGGGNVEFTWDADDAETVSIPRLNTTAIEGQKTIRLTSTETISLVATKNGDSISCPVRVTVDTGGGGGGSVTPRCELDISDRSISRGEEITLTWDSSRAADIKITDNHGKTLVTTHNRLSRDKDALFDGEIDLRPTKDTTYTMIAERGYRKDECEVDVTVDGGVVVTETRSQKPLVAGIALTQVPYTGFEAGPMLTFIFYLMLVIWGLFVAYVFVLRRKHLGGFSLAQSHGGGAVTDVTTEATTASDQSEAEAYVAHATATAPAPQNLPTADYTHEPAVGYASQAAVIASTAPTATSEIATLTDLENRAHTQKALFSSDAMRHLVNHTEVGSRDAELDRVIRGAKEQYPSENGWVVINFERISDLLGASTVHAAAEITGQTTPTTAGSLAEAVATGNVTAAYQMIAHRPMVALADAAADFDAIIRYRNGATDTVSDLLKSATEDRSEVDIRNAIHALTSALDGVYTDEAEAVKMGILKAIKALG